MAIILHLAVATVFLTCIEGWAFLDALYFAVVIATTIGYGDMTPVKNVSKIFVSVYAIVSVVFIARLLQTLVERFATAQSSMATSARSIILKKITSNSVKKSDSPVVLSQSQTADGTPYEDLIEETQLALRQARFKFQATFVLLFLASLSGLFLYKSFIRSSLIDIFYFLAITMTTVGLGDIHPITPLGKGYAIVWLVFVSLGFANVISQYATLRLKEQELNTVRTILSDKTSELVFNEIDVDHDGTLSEAEYLGYVVCKLGKVSPSEVCFHLFSSSLFFFYLSFIPYSSRVSSSAYILFTHGRSSVA